MALYVKRSQTIYSLTQLEDTKPQSLKKCPDCLVADVKGCSLPLLAYGVSGGSFKRRLRSFGSLTDLQSVPDIDDTRSDEDFSSDALAVPSVLGLSPGSSPSSSPTRNPPGLVGSEVPQTSMLDELLLAEWEDRAEQGLFRYDVTACATKMVPGPYGFIAQLNEGRASKKRPTEFRVDQVDQPFDPAKFNFTKALQKEVLFQFEPSKDGRTRFEEAVVVKSSPTLVFINVSPIEYGHVLLVPRVLDCLNQVLDPHSLLLALNFAAEAKNPYFRLGYNSLGAYGTINHLHIQAYYLAAPFAIERAPTTAIVVCKRKRGNVTASRLVEYPVRGLVFEAGGSLAELAELVGTACERLVAANIPHNLFIADCGARVFLLPNAFAERKAKGEVTQDVLDTQVDPAAFELSGHIVLKRQQDYNSVTQDFTWKMLEQASQTEEVFEQTVKIALDM